MTVNKLQIKCLVGVTSIITSKKTHWELKAIGFSNWEVFGPFKTNEDAIQKANELALNNDSTFLPKHNDLFNPNSIWWVYKFDHLGCRY